MTQKAKRKANKKATDARIAQEKIDAKAILAKGATKETVVEPVVEIPVIVEPVVEVVTVVTPPVETEDKTVKTVEVLEGETPPCVDEIIIDPTATVSPCDTGTQEVKGKKATEAEAKVKAVVKVKAKSKKQIKKEQNKVKAMEALKAKEAEANKEVVEDSTKNEKTEDISSVPSEPEPISVVESSNDSAIPAKDSSSVTTAIVEEEKKPPNAVSEVPHWVQGFVRDGWLKSHGTIIHPDGRGHIQIAAIRGYDSEGKPIEVGYMDVEPPEIKGLSEKEQKKVIAEFDAKIAKSRIAHAKELHEIYKKIGKMVPSFLSVYLKKVHCWNKAKDKDLNIVGIAVGLQGGREPYTVLIDIPTADGKTKKIKRGYKNISTTLPVGTPVSAKKEFLRNATDVEKGIKPKLLADKTPKKTVYPMGYDNAIHNLTSPVDHYTILVFNNQGEQLSFFATPITENGVETGNFEWCVMNMSGEGYMNIHNNAIAMKGSINELLRVTVKVCQDRVKNLLVVSIPKNDYGQLASFMEVLNIGAVTRGNDSEGQQEK